MANSEFGTEVAEIGGESGAEAAEAVESTNAHTPVAYTIQTAGTKPQQDGGDGEGGDGEGFDFNIGPFGVSFEAGAEGYGEESQFEAAEGWDESFLTEAAAEEASQEATKDAWYAEATEAEQQEFFAFLAPLILPLIKSAIPALAGAAAKNLPGVVGSIFNRLGRRRPKGRRETTGEYAEVDEAALEAVAQQLEVIIGKDDRVQIMNTTAVPWKRICHLQIESADGGRFLGSGALVGPRTVITAGHCVYMHTQGGWARSITVTPGRNGSSNPFGQCKAIGLRSVRGWVNMHKREYDYAAIILPRNCLKMQPPSAFGFASLSDASLKSKKLNLAGYPGDKPIGTMWYHGRKAKTVTPQTLVYDIDSMGGQSGSPVWTRTDDKRIMVGIHTNGSPTGNSATRITPAVLANMQHWRNEGQ